MFLKFLNKLSSMSQRQIIMLAGFTGLVMFGLLYITLSSVIASKPVEEVKVEEKIPVVNVVSAASNIPAQTIIQQEMLKVVQFPEGMKPVGTIDDISKVVGKIACVDILADDIVTDKKLFKSIEQAGFIGMIPSDCRAISIGISDITGVSGFVKPGDSVDVMMVYEVGNEIRSELILQNVLLLAMGKMAVQTDKGVIEGVVSGVASGMASGMANANSGSDKSSSTATLALQADEVLQVAAAAQELEPAVKLKLPNLN